MLHSYEIVSGQAINFQKSAIFFSSNVRRDKQDEIKSLLGVSNDLSNSNYLGLPSLIGRSKKSVFKYLKDRVWKRIQGWSSKLLSRAGKAVLIRNVAQAIPSYTMSCFLIPKTLCKEIERMMNAYWWKSNSTNNKGVKWLAWDRMCMSKKRGGLGFRDLHGFNLALLGKQCWNLISRPNALAARVLKARYYPNCHFLQASRGGGSSHTWAGIWEAKENFKNGFRWVLGDGRSIKIHTDNWLRGTADNRVGHNIAASINPSEKVREYFNDDGLTWDDVKVRSIFNEGDCSAILATRIPQLSTEDRVAWIHSLDGQYSVKSGYKQWHLNQPEDSNLHQSNGWSRIWRLSVPHKLKYFIWRFCRGNLPLRYLLRTKSVLVPMRCAWCAGDIEHLFHLFFDCRFAAACWHRVHLHYDMNNVENASVWLLNILCSEAHDNIVKIVTVLWAIWFSRNKKIWEDKDLTPDAAVAWSSKQIKDWQEVNKKRQGARIRTNSVGNVTEQRWKPPSRGELKINVDASIFTGERSFRIGMVIRNDQGHFVQGKCMRFAGEISVLEAEMVGILEALRWVQEWPGRHIVIESDSILSVNAIQKAACNYLELGDLIRQCRVILDGRADLSVHFVRKHANKVAHKLARLPCALNGSYVISSPPTHVLETLMSDSLEI